MKDQDLNNSIYVWDPLVRLFHWSLVLSFIIAYISGEEESLIHIYAGYFIMGLIGFRLLWGLVGSRHARFSDFVTAPGTAMQYARDMLTGKAKHYLGHNPLGGWMVIALLLSLILTSISGLALYGAEGHGPLANNSQALSTVSTGVSTGTVAANPLVVLVDGREHDDDDRGHHEESAAEELWEEIHEFFSHVTVLLIFVHIGGVMFASVREGQNLVRAMVNGYKEKT
ncbi:MAG: cytochrome b/b6 domain-containing protein [Gammaproteobacteria bacterium]|nr:cytochrome b/b6 domain-containing protein [Gammaproteobacteria bacterium]